MKTYPRRSSTKRRTVALHERNERKRAHRSARSNWVAHGIRQARLPTSIPKRYIVTVVNNRGDRVARSEVFARFLVRGHRRAHRHILIGSNVSRVSIGFVNDRARRSTSVPDRARRSDLAAVRQSQRYEDRRATRLGESIATSLKIAQPTVAERRSNGAEGDRNADPARDRSEHDRARVARRAGLNRVRSPPNRSASIPQNVPLQAQGPFVVGDGLSRRRVWKSAGSLARSISMLATDPARLEKMFRATSYTRRSSMEQHSSRSTTTTLTGDQIIDTRRPELVPPKARMSAIMGVQNIKGTGLDFVYRWVSVRPRSMRALGSSSKFGKRRPKKTQALRELRRARRLRS